MAFKINFFKCFIIGIILFSIIPIISAANPSGPDQLTLLYNSSKAGLDSKSINVSGGYIGVLNISANNQNYKWKGFVGYVTGKYALSDGAGSTIFDWTLVSSSGRIYATRNSTHITWSTINCSSFADLNNENYLMNHTNPNDNITGTFNAIGTGNHTGFTVGTKTIAPNECHSLKTYINNATHPNDNYFEEVALFDGYNIIYSTRVEPTRPVGYNGVNYDFQMIVPENGLSTWTGSTIYYFYIELGN